MEGRDLMEADTQDSSDEPTSPAPVGPLTEPVEKARAGVVSDPCSELKKVITVLLEAVAMHFS